MKKYLPHPTHNTTIATRAIHLSLLSITFSINMILEVLPRKQRAGAQASNKEIFVIWRNLVYIVYFYLVGPAKRFYDLVCSFLIAFNRFMISFVYFPKWSYNSEYSRYKRSYISTFSGIG
jgi:hypothetical protein